MGSPRRHGGHGEKTEFGFTTESPFGKLRAGRGHRGLSSGRRQEAEGRSLISSEETKAFNAGGRRNNMDLGFIKRDKSLNRSAATYRLLRRVSQGSFEPRRHPSGECEGRRFTTEARRKAEFRF